MTSLVLGLAACTGLQTTEIRPGVPAATIQREQAMNGAEGVADWLATSFRMRPET